MICSASCDASLIFYRSCGAGCKWEIGYCEKHGGDSRAVKEMEAHVQTAHDLFCPQHGRKSRPLTIEGLRCDCEKSWPLTQAKCRA
jgi:hypothetical protein